MMTRSVRVGIVGGGAAGVIAAKCLREAGHSVVVFEKAKQLGGVWNYEDATHTDASMYKSLRTNLPTSVMQLDDFAFAPDTRTFPSHRDVLTYIQSYASHFHVTDVVRFDSKVVGIAKQPSANDPSAPIWQIDVQSADRGSYSERVDKVLICNGHFAVPAYAKIPGIEYFKGETLHSHDYRTADRFHGKTVLLLGHGPSGSDISLELARSGANVTVAFKECSELEPSPLDKRTLKPPIDRILSDGSVVYQDGSTQDAPDVLMYCTGYLYVVKDLAPRGILYPELEISKGALSDELRDSLEAATAAGNAIAPLYKQLFSIEEPDVAFVGLPFKNLPFLSFELQSKWIARVFSDAEPLPSKEKMFDSFFDEVRTLPFPVRKFHQLGLERQNAYFEELASFARTKINRHVQAMFVDAGFLRFTYPLHYREAEYKQDPSHDGQWVRRLVISDAQGQPEQELVHIFE